MLDRHRKFNTSRISSSLAKLNCFLMFCHCLHIPSRVLSFSPPAFCLSHSVLLAGNRATTAQIHATKTLSLRPLSQHTFLISKFLEFRRDNTQRLPEQRRKLLYTSILKNCFFGFFAFCTGFLPAFSYTFLARVARIETRRRVSEPKLSLHQHVEDCFTRFVRFAFRFI